MFRPVCRLTTGRRHRPNCRLPERNADSSPGRLARQPCPADLDIDPNTALATMSTLGCLVAPGLGVGWGWDLGLGEACVPGEVARRSGAIAPWGRGTTRPGRRCDASAICRVTRGGAVPPPWERAGDTDGGGWLDRELDRFPGGGRWSSCCWSRWSPASASCRGGSGGPPRRRGTPWAEPGRRSPTPPPSVHRRGT